MNLKTERIGIVLGVAAMVLAGCQNATQTPLEKQVREDAAGMANRVGTAAKKTAQQAVKDTSTTAAETLQKSIKSLRASNYQLRVRAALGVSQNLDGTSISVGLKGNQVELTGTVRTAKQKKIAQQIAVNTLEGKMKVVNKLTVTGESKTASKKP